MNTLIRLLLEFDREHNRNFAERFLNLWSVQQIAEKTLIAEAASYNDGLLSAARIRESFLKNVEGYFMFSQEAEQFLQDEIRKTELDIAIAEKRVAEQKARDILRSAKSPAQILYQKLRYELNQFQLGVKSLDDVSAAMSDLTKDVDPSDIQLVNIRDEFLSKIKYIREQQERDQSRQINDLELGLLRKVQFYRAGILSYDAYKDALNEYVLQGQTALSSGSSDDFSQAQISAGESAQNLLRQLDTAQEKRRQKWKEDDIRSMLKISAAKLSLISDEQEKELAEIEHSYQKKRSVIELEIQDESEKAALITQLNQAMHRDLEAARLKQSLGFQSFLAVSKSAFSSLWSNILIGHRQAKDEWDALWLDMKNSALRRIYELLEHELVDYLFDFFIKIGLGDLSSFFTGNSTPGLPVGEFENFASPVFSGGAELFSSAHSDRIIRRLDNLESAILGKSWSIKGEDIYTANKLVSNRRSLNAL